ncbi:MAG: peptidase C39 [Eubacteriales bacterium]|nr:peptidase C39 [Eubacteriales bacterium]
MKNPLRYQISEYDCGPTALLDGISYLFEREQIPPELIRNIMLYCLDCYSPEGESGKSGTSCTAMMFLSNWLDGFGRAGQLPVSSGYLSGSQVHMGQNGGVCDALRRKGAAVVRLFFDIPHYVLLTGIEGDSIRMFDPYYMDRAYAPADVRMVEDAPFSHNRLVPVRYFERESEELYSLGPMDGREAVLLFNEATKLTSEKTIEYFI